MHTIQGGAAVPTADALDHVQREVGAAIGAAFAAVVRARPEQAWAMPTRADGTPYALPREAVLTADECRRILGGNGRPLGEDTFEALGLPYVNLGAGEAKHRNRRYLWGAILDALFGEQAA
jgi:hypothetical protein